MILAATIIPTGIALYAIEQEAEAELWQQRDFDPEARKELARRFADFTLGVVVSFVRQRQIPARFSIDELLSAGFVGMMSAIGRYRPELGFSPHTFLSRRIRGAVIDELRASNAVPKPLLLELKEAEQVLEDEPSDQAFTRAAELRSTVSARRPRSLSDQVGGEDGPAELAGLVPAEEGDPVLAAEISEELDRIAANVTAREYAILYLTYAEGLELREIAHTLRAAEGLKISPGHIWKIRTEILARLRRELGPGEHGGEGAP